MQLLQLCNNDSTDSAFLHILYCQVPHQHPNAGSKIAHPYDLNMTVDLSVSVPPHMTADWPNALLASLLTLKTPPASEGSVAGGSSTWHIAAAQIAARRSADNTMAQELVSSSNSGPPVGC